MKKLFSNGILFGTVIVIALFAGTTASAQKKSDASSASGGVKLVYKYPEGKSFKYVTDTKIVEDMDVNGQSMLVNVAMNMACEIKAAGKQDENLKLVIKIDSMSQMVESPQGSGGGSINDVKGKEFNIIISPQGKAIDISEASKITYTVEGSGETNLSQTFSYYFPVFPAGEIKQGDTWTTNDTLNSKTPSSSMWMPVTSVFKFDGTETINGIECARISATQSGTRKMVDQSQGMEIHVSGPYTGTQIFFIAIKEGYLVKESVTSKMNGNIEMPDQGMSFPVVMTINSGKELTK